MKISNVILAICATAMQMATAEITDFLLSDNGKDSVPVKVALIVQNHAAPGSNIPMMALTDALTANLSGYSFRVVNPYNAIGSNQNRTVLGEKTPHVSALALARKLGADGLLTASVTEFVDETFGVPVKWHQFTVRLAFNLADASSGVTVCGDTVKMKSERYTVNQVSQNKTVYLTDLLHSAAAKCAALLKANPAVQKWTVEPRKPVRRPPPPLPSGPLTISDVDGVVGKLLEGMRLSPVFRANYDNAQRAIGRTPLVIIGGIVDMTDGKTSDGNISNLLAAGAQRVRMDMMNSGLFEAKDDAVVSAVSERIIKSGNSPLEDGELLSALKQHGSPDFYVVGDLMCFSEGKQDKYRFRLALHNLHTGKIVFEDVHTVLKTRK